MVRKLPFFIPAVILFIEIVLQHIWVFAENNFDVEEESAVSNLIEGCNRFSFDLLRTLNSNQTEDPTPKDLFFSPFSVWSALIVTYMGARGSTRQEMRQVLGIENSSKSETWRAFKSLGYCDPRKLNEPRNDSYSSANRIYFQKGTSLKKYIRKMLDHSVAFVDFQNHSEEARKIINTWVEKYTHNMIRNLIPREIIGKQTKMVIANAVYFRETWLQPFDPKKTIPRGFTTSTGEKTIVPMMFTKGMFLHGQNDELQCSVLDLPYSDNSLGMIILLPNDRNAGVDHLVDNLTPDTLKNLFESLLPREVMVSIPKFKFEDAYELSTVLKGMGLKNLFDNQRINLSGFTGVRELKLDSVRHKTVIDVNEMGTEAAATSDLFYFKNSGPHGRATFVADHPFIYLIQDYNTNAILFLGVVNDPIKIRG